MSSERLVRVQLNTGLMQVGDGAIAGKKSIAAGERGFQLRELPHGVEIVRVKPGDAEEDVTVIPWAALNHLRKYRDRGLSPEQLEAEKRAGKIGAAVEPSKTTAQRRVREQQETTPGPGADPAGGGARAASRPAEGNR